MPDYDKSMAKVKKTWTDEYSTEHVGGTHVIDRVEIDLYDNDAAIKVYIRSYPNEMENTAFKSKILGFNIADVKIDQFIKDLAVVVAARL